MARRPIADEEPVPAMPPPKSGGRYYVLIGFSVLFVGVFIGASLLVKSKFPSNAGTTKTGDAPKPVAGVSGHYIGYTTLQTGICSVGAREFVIDIDEDGTAKSDYGVHGSRGLSGRASPDGKLRLNYRDGDYSVRFDGEIKQGHITGRSSVSGDSSCSINWDLYRY